MINFISVTQNGFNLLHDVQNGYNELIPFAIKHLIMHTML